MLLRILLPSFDAAAMRPCLLFPDLLPVIGLRDVLSLLSSLFDLRRLASLNIASSSKLSKTQDHCCRCACKAMNVGHRLSTESVGTVYTQAVQWLISDRSAIDNQELRVHLISAPQPPDATVVMHP